MPRLAMLLAFTLVPISALAQTPAQVSKAPAATAPRPGTPQAPAARPPTRKPAPTAKAPVPSAALLTDDQKIIYALGIILHRSIEQFDLTSAELDIVKRALTDAALRKPAIELDDWGPKIAPFAHARGERVTTREKAVSVAYLAKAAAEAGSTKTGSGLIYRELTAGTGASPKVTDTVRVHYRGTLINGTEFDSSYQRNEPAEFSLGGVIGCWTEGVQKMKVGGKARLVCPSDLAYGDQGSPPIPGGAALIFEVELLAIVPTPR
ncbi:MAG: FKBP-type peptidyl-prolyl cis-trans isomerase [Vicinamibacterales bacterium]